MLANIRALTALPHQCCEGMDAKISKKACYLA
jgi:hypothetical protein